MGLLYEVDEANHAKTYHFDQVGSTIARTDDDGNVIGRASYSAYGSITLKSGDMATPFLYNGQAGVQTDSNGLLNMRARYYSPYLMRFLNSDPSGFSGGSNWFAYADGNPISLSDPFGLCAESGGFIGYNSFGDYWHDATDSLGGVAIGLTEGLSGGVIGIDDSTIAQMNELQLTGYHSGLVISLIGAFFAPEATSAPVKSGTAWPPNRGFLNPPDLVTIQPGSLIDRAGSTGGTFAAPEGTPFGQRSLPADFVNKPLNTYEVMKPIGAEAGITAPWFDQPGGGIQFELNKPVQSLLDSGHLRTR